MACRIECVEVEDRSKALGAEGSEIHWAESPAASTLTTNSAPSTDSLFIFIPDQDVYVNVGTAPAVVSEPRRYIAAGQTRAIFVASGYKAIWAAA